MEVTTVLSSVGMMAIIVGIGAIIGKVTRVTVESKQLLVIIILNIALPSIILNGIFSIEMNDLLLSKMLTIFIMSIIFNALGIGLGWISAVLLGFREMNAKLIAILAGLGNTGFIGIPLCATLFGPTGGLLAAIFDAGLDVIVFTLVVVLLNKNGGFTLKGLKAIINLPIIAIVVGIAIAITGYEPPLLVKNLIATFAGLAAPLAMIYIGLLIATLSKKKKAISLRFISISLLMKLLVFPLMMIIVLQVIPITEDLKLVALVQVSMPTFMLATILFARYDHDEETAVMTTVYSTMFSLITIPLIVYITTLFL
ncbi:AEC family transporter [Sporosarcina thermotolerans]|uniref:AEC family transporter n=1 Tax=Sporosarcina thermotolerans TaxID=633404 RepID=A0AAW9A7U6_9BACL|nr:AEC family transporter [Sporosarcina thermotolerans]MDW0117482.1 AEC family transporter [Sporosarcina thermotolerans]WHT49655.1 AEC family transporter [Sporosarcina thermotolerans]